MSSSEAQADINIQQALAAARKKGPTATVSKPDNIQVILRAAKTGGLRTQTPERTATQTTCGPPVAPVQSQQEQEVVQKATWVIGTRTLLAYRPTSLPSKGREVKNNARGVQNGGAAPAPRDEAKRGWQTPSSNDSEPAIDWNKNKIGPATWESAGPQAPKSPAKTSRAPSSVQSNSQPAPRYSQSRPSSQNERKDEAACKEKSKEAKKKLEEEIILKYPGTFISTRIVDMLSEHFKNEARSLRFFEGGAMSRTKELVALADWGYQYSLISHSPLPDIPVFLQQSCFGSKNAVHDVPAAPLRYCWKQQISGRGAGCSGLICVSSCNSGRTRPPTWR